MRKLLLLFAALLLLPTAAQAQADFSVLADSNDIKDGGTLSSIELDGLTRLDDGGFVFYNESTGDLVTYDDDASSGSRTTILRSNADIDDDLGTDIDRIRTLDVDDDGNVYLSLSDDTDTDQIYKVSADGSSGTVLAQADGANGLAVFDDTVYLGVQAFFNDSGDLDNGVYSISTTGAGQTPTEIFTSGGLDLGLLDEADGTLYGFSGTFGSAPYQGALLRFDDLSGGTPAIIATPFADDIFTDTGDGVGDIVAAELNDEDRIYLYNGAFDGPDGEEFGVFQGDGSNDGLLFATETDAIDDGDIDNELTRTENPLTIDDDSGDLFFANRDAFGGADEIIRITDAPLPVEFAGAPQATVSGQDVTLAWTTLSEHGNAGFQVQHQRAGQSGWTTANDALVEGAGTATTAHSYRYTVRGLDPGSYSFRVRQVDINDDASLSPTVEVNVGAGGFALQAPAQNPLRGGGTTLSYSAPEEANVQAALYNSLGQQVRTLRATNGEVSVEAGGLASGLYFVRLVTAGGQVQVQSVTLVR